MLKTTLILLLAMTLAASALPDPNQSLEDLHKSAKQSISDKNLDAALEQYKDIYGKDPKSVDALFNIGWIYNEQKKFDTAARWLKKAADLDAQNARVQSELGFAYAKLNNPAAAVEAYTKATEIKADSPAAWVALGDVNYELKKDSKAASAAYLKAVELGNASSATYYRLGWCFNDLNQFDKAAPQLKQAAALEPKSAAVWLEWGYSLLRAKKYEQAVEALTRATVLEPKERLGHLYLGRTFLLMKNKAQARRQIDLLKPIDASTASQLESELKAAGDGK